MINFMYRVNQEMHPEGVDSFCNVWLQIQAATKQLAQSYAMNENAFAQFCTVQQNCALINCSTVCTIINVLQILQDILSIGNLQLKYVI